MPHFFRVSGPLFSHDPWSSGPRRSNQSSNGGFDRTRRPDIDEAIQRAQERMRRFFGSVIGGGDDHDRSRNARRLMGIGGVLLVGFWLLTGLYRVETGQRGVELVFGDVSEVTQPGLRYNWPTPIGTVYKPEVERSRRFLIGQRQLGGEESNNAVTRDVPEQSLILTGDENIVDMDYTVFWKISDPVKYLFHVRDQQGMLETAAQSAMREVIGQTSFDLSVTTGRAQIETSTLELLQNIVDTYDAGVLIEQVVLQKSDPPQEVIDAFNDVQRARQDRDRMRNEAEAYANSILPEARGQVELILREAEAYKEKMIVEAEGEANRFLSVVDSFQANPEIVRYRMYYETMSEVIGSSDRVLMSPSIGGGGQGNGSGNGVVPYLPLSDLLRRPSVSSSSQDAPSSN